MTIYTPALIGKFNRYIQAEVPRYRSMFETNKIDTIDVAFLSSERTGFATENHCPPQGDIAFFILKDFFNLEEGRPVDAAIPFHPDIMKKLATETVEAALARETLSEAVTETEFADDYFPACTRRRWLLPSASNSPVSQTMIKHAQEATLNVFRQLKYDFYLYRFGPEFDSLQVHPMYLMSEFLCNRDPEFQGEMLLEYLDSFS